MWEYRRLILVMVLDGTLHLTYERGLLDPFPRVQFTVLISTLENGLTV